ncbi:helix-turn-helix domain-containing protein [Mycetocola tolaasinivorans]|uniref:Helix-turn-helix domain-containing protein n=1 Tax=Mycetocola tolaasinivorans TaxID=76635 RepID=A0A3L6ZWB5_9MICO|nr:helix-turn-helix domain-containing protein [Mycetocola tolaasinivorans]
MPAAGWRSPRPRLNELWKEVDVSYKATAWAYELDLPSPRKFVLVALADFADEAGSCYPGQERLAAMTGLSESTVRRSIRDLESEGLLATKPRFEGGHRLSNRYLLSIGTQPVTLTGTNRSLTTSQPVTHDESTGHSDRGTIKEPSVNHQGGVAPSPTCGKHPQPTTEKCGPCGTARRLHDAYMLEVKAAAKAEREKPSPRNLGPALCITHYGYPLPCDRCAEDREEAAA